MNPEQNSGNEGGQLPPQNVYPPQPQPTAPPIPQAPVDASYDFIFNPEKPQKKPLLPGSGSSMMRRLLIAGGGLVILIIVAVVGMSLLSGSDNEKTDLFLTVAQDQTELIRVSTAATTQATSISAQNLAQDVKAAITSDIDALSTYMAKNGQKVTVAQLTLKHNATTDKTLLAAQENNSYDSAFKDIMKSDLQSYMAALQTAYKSNPGPKGKDLLAQQYNSAELLLKVSQQQ